MSHDPSSIIDDRDITMNLHDERNHAKYQQKQRERLTIAAGILCTLVRNMSNNDFASSMARSARDAGLDAQEACAELALRYTDALIKRADAGAA